MSLARLSKGLLLAVGVALVAYLTSDSVRTRVLARVERALEARLGEVQIGQRFVVGWDGTLTMGPVELPGSRSDLPPTVRVERLIVRPELRALLSGQVKLDELALEGVRVEGGDHGGELLALLERIRERRDDARGVSGRGSTRSDLELPPVRVSELQLGLSWDRRIELGPIDAEAQVTRPGGSTRLELEATLPHGGTSRLIVERAAGAEPTGRWELRDVSTEALLAQLDLPFRSYGGTLDAELRVEGSTAHFSAQLQGMSLSGPELASEPVGPLAVGAEGEARWNAREERLELESVRVSLGKQRTAQVSMRGGISLRAEPRFELEAELEPLSFAEALAAIPKALTPEPGLLDLQGRFSARLSVSGPVRHPQDWEVRAKIQLAELERQARSSPLASFNAPFAYRPLLAEGRGRQLHVGPANPDFVPYAELPHALVRAVLLSEDSMFFTHAGFDVHALKRNLLAPKKEGAVIRGGSTLTQQLAKNLFLSREKTYARKVKEALLTLALEASVPKERLLEIYFNVVEWGPDLYGIGEAARHYFDKDARDLTVREAVFLAAIIPNPVKYHVYCSRGALSETWRKRMTDLLEKMHGAGDLSFEQLTEAEEASLVFAHR